MQCVAATDFQRSMRSKFTGLVAFLLIVLSFTVILVSCECHPPLLRPSFSSLFSAASRRSHRFAFCVQVATLAQERLSSLVPNLDVCKSDLPAAFFGGCVSYLCCLHVLVGTDVVAF